MKFKIIFYLFLFVCIILFFQLVNTNKILNHQDHLIQSQNSLQLRLKDSLFDLKKKLSVQQYFTFNEDYETYEEIKTKLLSYNINGDLKELIRSLPNNQHFLIDNIQIINAKWVLIGFQSNQSKGQAFLAYKKTTIGFEFNHLKSLIYPL